jgi:HSP20 family molecular chaperone IbpA
MSEEPRELQVEDTQKEIAESDAERTRAKPAFVPRADIYETEDKIVVVADMPGVKPEAVDVTVEQNTLTINGYVEPAPPEGYALAHAEYRLGDYQRRFALSSQIDQSKIEASMQDGVLRLHLPKAKPTTAKIAVKAG